MSAKGFLAKVGFLYRAGLCFTLCLSLAGLVLAQSEEHPVTVNIGGGLPQLLAVTPANWTTEEIFRLAAVTFSINTSALLEISCSMTWGSPVVS